MIYFPLIVFSMLVWGAHPAAVAAAGATYYVRAGGSDSHSCIQARTDTDAKAKASIQAGVNCVGGPGDTVIVHAGTYANFKSFTEIPGVSGMNLGTRAITLKAAPGETVTLRGALDMWNHSGEYWIIDRINIDGGYQTRNTLLVNGHTRIQNLEVKNSVYYGIGMGQNAEAINVRSHGHGRGPQGCTNGNEPGGGQCHGIYFHVSGLVDGGEYYDNDGHGVTAVYLSSGSVTIRNTKLYQNIGGIQYLGGPNNPLISNNLIYNNIAYGMWIDGGAFRVYNNTIYGNGGEAILDGAKTAGTTIRNNIIYNNGGNNGKMNR